MLLIACSSFDWCWGSCYSWWFAVVVGGVVAVVVLVLVLVVVVVAVAVDVVFVVAVVSVVVVAVVVNCRFCVRANYSLF